MVAIILTEALFGAAASSSCADFNYLSCPCFSSKNRVKRVLPSGSSSSRGRVTSNVWFTAAGSRIIRKRDVGVVYCSLVDKQDLEFKPSFSEYLKAMEESLKEKKKKKETEADTAAAAVIIRRKKEVEEKGKVVKLSEKKLVERGEEKMEFRKVKKNQSFKEHVDDMERAAFNSMEDDVCDKPRVTKAEMEARIQKLANCLNGADVDVPEWMFSKMMRSAQIRFSDHSMLRVIQILGKFGNWRRVLQVIEWIRAGDRFKSNKLRYIYTTALDVMGKAKRPVEALNLFHAMQEHISSYPDLVAYHSIAVTLGQAGHMKELFDVIDTMRSPPEKKFNANIIGKFDPRIEPDVVVYNAVLNACVHRKSWEGAFWVLQQLELRDQQPSITTYGLVMEVMFECGKYNLVHDFFKKMQKSCVPNALSYKVLVSTLWKEGKTDKAILAVKDMERRGIVGGASLYYDLARCLCSAGRCEEALAQMEKICKVATKPLVVTYTGLIQACLEAGDIQSGEYIFSQMHQFCSPNLVTYNIMLKAYLDNGMCEEAKQLFFKLLDNGSSMSTRLDGKDKVLPDVYTFNLMLDAFAAEKKWDDLNFTYSHMLQFGYHFNTKRHMQIVLDSCSAGKVEILEATWKNLAQGDRVPPLPLVKEMFRVQLGRGNFAGAMACVADYPSDESQAFSAKFWTKFFLENADKFSDETLFRLLQEVSPVATRNDSKILNTLMFSCKEFLRNRSAKVDRVQRETALVC